MTIIAEPESSGYLACVRSTKSNSDSLSHKATEELDISVRTSDKNYAVGVSSNTPVTNYFKSAEWYDPFMSKFTSVYITELPIF